MSYTNTYIWNLERTYLQRSNGDTDTENNRLMDTAREEGQGEGGTYGESNVETYITICKIGSQWEFAVWLRKLIQGLCINLEGWDGEGDGREVQKGGDIGMLLLLLSRFSRVQLCETPETAAHQAPPSLGFSRQEHWSGLPFHLQCMKVKSESEIAQSQPTHSDPMDCSPPGSSIHRIFQVRVLEWLAIAFSDCIYSHVYLLIPNLSLPSSPLVTLSLFSMSIHIY